MFNMMNDAKQSNQVNPLVLGRHLIEAGFTPSPLFGKVLSETYEIQLEYGYSFDELLPFAIEKMRS